MHQKLGRNLLVALLAAQVVTVLVLVLLSGRISADAEQVHTSQLLSSSTAESAEAVRAHVEPAQALVELTAALLSETDVESETLEQVFRASLIGTPQISGAFLGTPNQDFIFVSRDGEGFRHKVTTVDGTARQTTIGEFDANGDLTSQFEDPLDTYDPTSRPWYIAADTVENETVWTDPYVFFTSQQLGVTVSRAVLRDGDLIGVVGVDIALGSLSEFLADLEISNVGGTLLFDSSGTVLAHPEEELLQVPDGDGFRPLSILEFGDPYAQSAAGAFLTGDESVRQGTQNFEDDLRGPSRVAFESVQLGEAEWIMSVYAPVGALAPELNEARTQERILAAIAGLLTILVFLAFLLPATRKVDDLAHTASTDELTGIANRRSIMNDATTLAAASGPRAFAMLDIDHFKNVNDTYGHQVGDEVLKTVVDRLNASLSDSSCIGRVGGEEFLILLPDQTEEPAVLACEGIKASVSRDPIPTAAGDVDVTVSIGVTSTSGPQTTDTMLSNAYSALSRAKRSGRNSVVHQDIENSTLKVA